MERLRVTDSSTDRRQKDAGDWKASLTASKPAPAAATSDAPPSSGNTAGEQSSRPSGAWRTGGMVDAGDSRNGKAPITRYTRAEVLEKFQPCLAPAAPYLTEVEGITTPDSLMPASFTFHSLDDVYRSWERDRERDQQRQATRGEAGDAGGLASGPGGYQRGPPGMQRARSDRTIDREPYYADYDDDAAGIPGAAAGAGVRGRGPIYADRPGAAYDRGDRRAPPGYAGDRRGGGGGYGGGGAGSGLERQDSERSMGGYRDSGGYARGGGGAATSSGDYRRGEAMPGWIQRGAGGSQRELQRGADRDYYRDRNGDARAGGDRGDRERDDNQAGGADGHPGHQYHESGAAPSATGAGDAGGVAAADEDEDWRRTGGSMARGPMTAFGRGFGGLRGTGSGPNVNNRDTFGRGNAGASGDRGDRGGAADAEATWELFTAQASAFEETHRRAREQKSAAADGPAAQAASTTAAAPATSSQQAQKAQEYDAALDEPLEPSGAFTEDAEGDVPSLNQLRDKGEGLDVPAAGTPVDAAHRASSVSPEQTTTTETASSVSESRASPAAGPDASEGTASSSDDWYYCDPHGSVQGPFASREMRDWFLSGYFGESFPVRIGEVTPAVLAALPTGSPVSAAFTPLADLFPGQLYQQAFAVAPVSKAEPAASAPAPASAAPQVSASAADVSAPLPMSLAAGSAPAPASPVLGSLGLGSSTLAQMSLPALSGLSLAESAPAAGASSASATAALPASSAAATAASAAAPPAAPAAAGPAATALSQAQAAAAANVMRYRQANEVQQRMAAQIAAAAVEFKGQCEVYAQAQGQAAGVDGEVRQLENTEQQVRQAASKLSADMQQTQALIIQHGAVSALIQRMQQLQGEAQKYGQALPAIQQQVQSKAAQRNQMQQQLQVMASRLAINQQRISQAEATAKAHAQQLQQLASQIQQEEASIATLQAQANAEAAAAEAARQQHAEAQARAAAAQQRAAAEAQARAHAEAAAAASAAERARQAAAIAAQAAAAQVSPRTLDPAAAAALAEAQAGDPEATRRLKALLGLQGQAAAAPSAGAPAPAVAPRPAQPQQPSAAVWGQAPKSAPSSSSSAAAAPSSSSTNGGNMQDILRRQQEEAAVAEREAERQRAEQIRSTAAAAARGPQSAWASHPAPAPAVSSQAKGGASASPAAGSTLRDIQKEEERARMAAAAAAGQAHAEKVSASSLNRPKTLAQIVSGGPGTVSAASMQSAPMSVAAGHLGSSSSGSSGGWAKAAATKPAGGAASAKPASSDDFWSSAPAGRK